MTYETLVDVETLAAHLGDSHWLAVDCRFVLGDPEAGARAFAQASIPGAVFADLDRDLAGPVEPGRTGRHPLPSREAFGATLGRWGVDGSTQVIAFDDKGGAFAARLWWMMRWMGHRAAAVLDGGLPAWIEAGHRLVPGRPGRREAGVFEARASGVEAVDAAQVLAALADDAVAVLDARAHSRFRGEDETTDPVAGHIAGARSAPFSGNLGEDGRFKPGPELRARFEARLDGAPPERAIVYCGSGVTACHDLLAMAHAGMPMPRLYPGSWSDWITDPARPRATGDEG